MGQRANYIIKNHDQLTIHYNHWRANCILADLYLGEKRFLKFVEECQLNDEIMNEPWIEGCVVIDKPAKRLHFWSWEFSNETSVIEYYLSALAKKWEGWTVQFLKNRMYDVEKILGIDYISKQELPKLNTWSKEDMVNDKEEEWTTALVVIKSSDKLFVTKTGNLNSKVIVSYGQDVIPLLLDKSQYELPNEVDESTYECIVIDTAEKKLFINQSEYGLREQAQDLWKEYEFTMGDFGYIETLRRAGIDIANLMMTEEKVLEQFNNIVNYENNFDPYEMAEKLTNENSDIQFNPDFFDTVTPQKSMLSRLKSKVRRMFGRQR